MRGLSPLPFREVPGRLERLLVIRPGGLGDALLVLPFMMALRAFHPRADFWVLAEPRNAQAFSLLPFPCRVLLYTRPRELASLLLGPSFDAVIDTEQWYCLSALVARFVKSPFRVGFGTNARKGCFNVPVDYCQEEYEAQVFFRLLGPWGKEFPWWKWLPPGLDSEGEKEDPWIALFPGASHPSRRWGKDRYLEVARFLVGMGLKVAVVGGPGEKEEGEYVASAFSPGRVMDATGARSLRESMEILGRCRALVTADSSIMHLAALMGLPTLSLFGPGIVEKWAPRGEGDLVVKLDLPCSPCTRFGTVPPCPRDFACMRDLTPNMVIEALKDFLKNLGI